MCLLAPRAPPSFVNQHTTTTPNHINARRCASRPSKHVAMKYMLARHVGVRWAPSGFHLGFGCIDAASAAADADAAAVQTNQSF